MIISDEEIGSPIVRKPRAAIVMNLPSLDRYESLVVQGGVLIVNSSLVDRSVKRDDITTVEVPADEFAERIGTRRLANLVLIGALIQKLTVLELNTIGGALENHIPERHRELIEVNKQALGKGFQFAESQKVMA